MKFKLLLYFLITCGFKAACQEPAIFNDTWLKYSISQNGVHKISLSDLESKLPNFTTNTICVKGNTGLELPQQNGIINGSYLKVLPIKITDTDIWFYAETTSRTTIDSSGFNYHENPYESKNYVFVGVNDTPSPQIKDIDRAESTSNKVNSYLKFTRFEQNTRNFFYSGRDWVGVFFNSKLSIPLAVPTGSKVYLKTKLAGQTFSPQQVVASIGTSVGNAAELYPTTYVSTDAFLRYNRVANYLTITDTLTANANTLEISFKNQIDYPEGAYLDFTEYYFEQNIEYTEQQESLYFSPTNTVTELEFKGTKQDHFLWKINENEVKNLVTPKTILEPNSHFQLFKASNLISPQFIGTIENQIPIEVPNLLIVYPESLENAANELKALRKADGLEVNAVSTEVIYNAFSGGKLDPSAIRNYCRYLWQKDSTTFNYLVLLGDATYDYKNLLDYSFVTPENLVPTYQSFESFEPVHTYASDDYFGFLETHEGLWPEGHSVNNRWQSSQSKDHSLDISVGRIPANSNSEALAYINKLKIYGDQNYTQGKWKNSIGLVADNGDFNTHQEFVEEFSELLLKNTVSPFYVKKLFIDNYYSETQENLKASQALSTMVNEGTLIINYNGHGSEKGWAQEKLLTIDQIQNWTNLEKLPIFFTATCEFGKFDNPAVNSAAEIALLSPAGGAAALLTTTRPVYASTNKEINLAFFNELLSQTENTEIRLGDLFKATKNQSIVGEANRNFSLLGDPSMPLAIPIQNKIKLNSINGIAPDTATISTLSPTVIKGEINDPNFNGTLQVSLVNEPTQLETLGQGTANPIMQYKDFNRKVLESNLPIVNGEFSFSFLLPKLETNTAYLYLYGFDAAYTKEAINLKTKIKIDNNPTTNINDTKGPEIEYNYSPNLLKVHFYDTSGVNISDANHDISLTINDTLNVSLANFYVADSSFANGSLTFPFIGLKPGEHTVKLKCFDNYNNESAISFKIQIKENVDLIEQVNIYPNPVTENLNLEITNKNEGSSIDYQITIYNNKGILLNVVNKSCNQCTKKVKINLPLPRYLKSSGLYYYSIKQNNTTKTGRFLFIK